MVPTNYARMTGDALYPPYSFKFTINVLGGQSSLDVTNTIVIECTDSVIISYVGPNPLLYAVLLKTLTSGSTTDVIIDTTHFNTDDPACPIDQYSFTETTIASANYPLS